MKGMVMKNKILFLSLLITSPAAIFAADRALVSSNQRALTAREKVGFLGRVARWGGVGVCIYSVGALARDSFFETITPFGVFGTFSFASLVGFFYEKSQVPRRKREADQAGEIARLQHELNESQRKLNESQEARRVGTDRRFRELADAQGVFEEVRRDLEAANTRNQELVREINTLTESLKSGFSGVAQTLGVQHAVNLRVLAGIQRTNLMAHLTAIELNLDGKTTETAAVIRARETLVQLEEALRQLGIMEQRLQVVDGQQLALPATAAAMAALPASGTNS